VIVVLQMLIFAAALDLLGILTFRRWLTSTQHTRGRLVMAWVILIAAGLTEILWLVALKNSDGFEHTWHGIVSIALSWLSFFMLAYAMKFIAVGTAYAVWTGCGAIGAAVAGMLLFGESRSALRIVSIALIVAGIVGVRMAERASPERIDSGIAMNAAG
jgi:quaternary ammonium compound-resistance protein SugE